MRSIGRTPDYKFGRLVTANDAIPLAGIGEDWGWNFQHYEFANFYVVPVQNPPASASSIPEEGDISSYIGTPTSNPALEAYFYDRASKLWLKHTPALTFAAAGAGIAVSIELPAYGRRVGLAVTGGTTGGQGIIILVAGFGRQELE